MNSNRLCRPWAESQGSTESSRRRFVAPNPEAIARMFPQFDILDLVGQGGMGILRINSPAGAPDHRALAWKLVQEEIH